jgi:hypothetical protein
LVAHDSNAFIRREGPLFPTIVVIFPLHGISLISRSQACVVVRLRPSSTNRQGVNAMKISDAAGAHIWSKTRTPSSGADIIRTPAAIVNAQRSSPKKCHD